MSWRGLLRWLVEVFIQDWKSHEGWSQLTKQPGKEGARRGVILSLLVDHVLFLHPDQHAQLKNNLPAYTVGSLRAHVQVECLVDVIQELVSSDDPQGQLQRFTQALHEVVCLRPFQKASDPASIRATRTHSFFEVSGRGGHAQYTGDVNLKKLEDRVDMGNTASKSVQVFLEFVHLWSYASTQQPYTRRCRVDRHTRSGQTQCGDPDTEQHYHAATQGVERAARQC